MLYYSSSAKQMESHNSGKNIMRISKETPGKINLPELYFRVISKLLEKRWLLKQVVNLLRLNQTCL